MSGQRDVIFSLDMKTGVMTFHQNGPWANAMGLCAGTPYDYAWVLERLGDDYVDRDFRSEFYRVLTREALQAAFARHVPVVMLDCRIRQPESSEYEWYRIHVVTPIGGKSHGTVQNMQQEKLAELDLHYHARHDGLTRLLNRRTFSATLQEHLEQGRTGAVFILDVDNFKHINDFYGHITGDRTLVALAGHLRAKLPRQTLLGRFGGDEFQGFIPDITPGEELDRLLAQVLQLPEELAQQYVSLSVGLAFAPDHGATISELLSCADCALYGAKAAGKNRAMLYDASMARPGARSTPTPEKRKRPPGRAWATHSRMLGLFAVLMATSVLLFFFTRQMIVQYHSSVQLEAERYLEEISAQVSANTANRLTAWQEQIYTVGNALNLMPSTTSEVGRELYLQSVEGDFELSLVDTEGYWHQEGTTAKLYEFLPYVLRCLETQETFFTPAVHYRGADYVACITPISVATPEGRRFVALAGLIRLDNLRDSLSLTAFADMGFVEIFATNGNMVIRSDNPNSLVRGYNLFASLEQAQIQTEASLALMEEDFAQGRKGLFRYHYGAREYIALYSKLEGRDWFLYTTLPADVLEERTNESFRIAMAGCLAVTLLMAGMMGLLAFSQVRSRKKIERVAYVDPVTGGASRTRFILEAQSLLRQGNAPYSLLYLNVDQFKVANDRLGTEKANDLLCALWHCIDESLKEDDRACRLSADHFALLVATQERSGIMAYIHRISGNMEHSRFTQLHQYTVGLSFGVYPVDNPQLEINLIIDRANIARQSAQNGSNIGYYDARLRKQLLAEKQMEDRMHFALEQGEFVPYLQPKCDAATRKIVGYEALARWQIPGRGMVSPVEFIPLFERNGFVVQVDLYMFEQVCRLQHQRMTDGLPLVPISFNLSRLHLASPDMLEPYVALWHKYEVPASCLEFEFTESLIFENLAQLNGIVAQLHSCGFRCSIDDFGAGHSSLNMLHQVQMDVVKIDQKFLSDGKTLREESRTILAAIVQLVHQLGMRAVMEGVEYAEHADYLQSCGCDLLQGYYFSRPLPVCQAMELLDKQEENL